MRLIIGLGNPGKQYDLTRHNVGFFILDKIKNCGNFSDFEFNKKFNAEISKELNKQKEIILIKPQTFMNLSGESIRFILDFYKLSPKDILVIHDDIDIPIGKYKIAVNSSSAGHNGVKSIIENLKTQDFKRIRIGISKEISDQKSNTRDFVLEKFSPEEIIIIEKIFEDILKEIQKT